MDRHRHRPVFHILGFSLLLGGAAAPAAAQPGSGHGEAVPVTGKIVGTVYDRDSRAPLVGGQVIVDGTNLGNITNDDGHYFINGVPVGVQRIRSEYLGYESLSQDLRILAGQTATVDFAMASELVAADAIVAVVEREPIPLKAVERGYTTVSVLPTHIPDPVPVTSCEPTVTLHGSYIVEGEWQLQVSVGRLRCGDQVVECRPVVVQSPAMAAADGAVGSTVQ